MFVDVAFTHGEVEFIDLQRFHFIAVVDVLRATSAMTTALTNGARAIKPAATPEEAREFAAAWQREHGGPPVLLGGERGARRIPDFDLGNSPFDYTPEAVRDRLIAMTTTNGTQAFRRVEGAPGIVAAACLRNAGAVVDAMTDTAGGTEGGAVLIVCAGTDGRFSADDAYCAGVLVQKLTARIDARLGDGAAAARRIVRSSVAEAGGAADHGDRPEWTRQALAASRHGQRLLGMGLERDVQFCAETDAVDGVPRLKMGMLVLE